MIDEFLVFVRSYNAPMEIDAASIPNDVSQVGVFAAKMRVDRLQQAGARRGEMEEEDRMGRAVA